MRSAGTLARLVPRDLAYAARSLRGSPGFTVMAVLSLVLGIGLNTTVFSVVEAGLLRPLPYADADRLHGVQDPRRTPAGHFLSGPEFQAYRRESRSFAGVAAYRAGMGSWEALALESAAGRSEGYEVSAELFRVLGAGAALGRTLLPGDERGGERPVVIGHGVWRREFGGSAAALGKTLRIGGVPHTVVGVMPEGFWFPSPTGAFWVPLLPGGAEWEERDLSLVGRLRPGVGGERAAAEAAALVGRFDAAGPSPERPRSARVTSLDEARRPSDGAYFYVLQGVVLCLLLIACSNVASLLLARAVARRRETALRAALGASRWQVVRPVLAESLLLVAIAGVCGVLASRGATRLLAGVLPAETPMRELLGAGLNVRVLGAGVAAAAVCVLACTLAPALHAARTDLGAALKDGASTTSAGAGAARSRGWLVVAQIALSLVLLVNAGVLLEQVGRLGAWKPSFAWERLFRVELGSPASGDRLAGVLQRAAAVPGVLHAAAEARFVPQGGRVSAAGGEEDATCRCLRVTRDYLEALGVPVVRGRGFAETDVRGGDAAIVDERMAARLWGAEEAVGRRLRLGPAGSAGRLVTVVGVARKTDFERPSGAGLPAPGPVYLLSAEDSIRASRVWAAGAPGAAVAGALRDALSGAAGGAAPPAVRRMEAVLSAELAPLRGYAAMFALFAGLGLALGAVGLYGLISYGVAQRRREFGIRMALGAGPRHLVPLVVRDALRLAVLGVALGAVGACVSGMLIASLLFGSRVVPPVAFVPAGVAVAAVVCAASLAPVVRTIRMNAADVLRVS